MNRWIKAVRLPFLSVTLIGCWVGWGTAYADGLPIQLPLALATVVFALIAHAGANVLNDLHDALNGSDLANVQRVYPFTGGSRSIQDGHLSLNQTRLLAYGLLLAVVPAGLALVVWSAPGLMWIGALGLAVAWAYSAPPLQLMSKGLGEWAVVLAWLLVVVGADFVQRGGWSMQPVWLGLPYAMMVALVLLVNQFPDAAADASANKRTTVVKLGVSRARWVAVLLMVGAYALLGGWVITGLAPQRLWMVMGVLPLSIAGLVQLWPYAGTPQHLAGAIKITILSTCLFGLIEATGLILARA